MPNPKEQQPFLWFVPALFLQIFFNTEVPTDSADARAHARYQRMLNHLFSLLQAALCEPTSTLKVLLWQNRKKTVQRLINLLLQSTRSKTSLPKEVSDVFSAEPNPPPSPACVAVAVPAPFGEILKLAMLLESTPAGKTAGLKVFKKLREWLAAEIYEWPIWLPFNKNLPFTQLLHKLNDLASSTDHWLGMLDALGSVQSTENVSDMTWIPWELISKYLRQLPVVRANLSPVLNLPHTAPLDANLAKLSSDVRAILDKLLALQICPALPSPTSRQ
jgi:hypothetical protein